MCQYDELMEGDKHTELCAAISYFTIEVEGPVDGFFQTMAVTELPKQETRNTLSDDVFEIVRNRNNWQYGHSGICN